MGVAQIILRWVVQPICTLVIGRACLAIAHTYEWYPEQQLARLLMAAPSALENDLILWGLAAVIGTALWAITDYIFYRTKTVVGAPKVANLRATAPPQKNFDKYESQRAEKVGVLADGLEKFIASGKELYRRSLTSGDDYAEWRGDYKSWMGTAEEFVRAHIGHQAAGDFQREPRLMVADRLSDSFNDEHDARRTRLACKLEDLTRHLERAKDNPYWRPKEKNAGEAWAMRDRIELYDIACLLADRPLQSPFVEPQRSYHRRLKDAVTDGALRVANMRGSEANMLTLVMRDDLRTFAQASKDQELMAFLKRWDALNPRKRKRKNGSR